MLPPRIDTKAVQAATGEYADDQETLAQRAAIYQDLISFVPPRIEARLNVTDALDPQMLDLQERIREHGMYPKCFDEKTAQLMLFGMLLMDLSDAAPLHAIAARKSSPTRPSARPKRSLLERGHPMNPGIIAAAVVPHVPTLGLPENTPEFQLTLVEGERELGRSLRELKPGKTQ